MSPANASDGAAGVAATVGARAPGRSLAGSLYTSPEAYEMDLALVWHREWVFAGHECELANAGDFLTLTVGAHPLLVVRTADGELRALHNVCRHRGFVVCEDAVGHANRRFVCPYHQWSYELDGRLARARALPDDLRADDLGLGVAHCTSIGGLVFVCVADEAPDIEPLRAVVEPYLAPFDLVRAKVAATSVIVEQGNWKLVMENNRECYHCRGAHSELCRTFPEAPLHSGGGAGDELTRMQELIDRCEAAGLPSRFVQSADHQFRAMRMPLLAGTESMTMDGRPAVAKRFGGLPSADTIGDVGDVLLYHYPSTWNHFTADHAITFRMLPTGPTTTELRTTWLVPGDAVEGADYDVDRLTEVWLATNAQDTALVERTQRGVASPAYRPGPHAPDEEDGVIQFIEWYATTIGARSR